MSSSVSVLPRALALSSAVLAWSIVSAQPQPSSAASSDGKLVDRSVAGNAAASGRTGAAALSAADRQFMVSAAGSGMAEVQLGTLAAHKAAEPAVKQFGETMVRDHTKANDALAEVAMRKGVALPSDIPMAERREHDKLSKMSGSDFDREYTRHMVTGHQKVADIFRAASRSAQDPDVRQFARQTLPTIEHHLQMAKALTKGY